MASPPAAPGPPSMVQLRREVSSIRQDAVRALRALQSRDAHYPPYRIEELRDRLRRCKEAIASPRPDAAHHTTASAATASEAAPHRRRTDTERIFRSVLGRTGGGAATAVVARGAAPHTGDEGRGRWSYATSWFRSAAKKRAHHEPTTTGRG